MSLPCTSLKHLEQSPDSPPEMMSTSRPAFARPPFEHDGGMIMVDFDYCPVLHVQLYGSELHAACPSGRLRGMLVLGSGCFPVSRLVSRFGG